MPKTVPVQKEGHKGKGAATGDRTLEKSSEVSLWRSLPNCHL